MYFKFKAFADLVYPLQSESAENTRIEWLKRWLNENGYQSKKFTILARAPVAKGNTYSIYYEVKVEK